MRKLNLPDYQALAEFRYQIRKFLHFSEVAVQAAGLERGQYQLMLAIKGIPEGVRPRIRELANRMHIQHHSAVELVNRLVSAGFEPVHQLHRAVMLNMHPVGELSDPRPHSLRYTLDGQHELVLPPLQPSGLHCHFAEMQEFPDLIPKLSQRLIVWQVKFPHTADCISVYRITIVRSYYIVNRYTKELSAKLCLSS